MKSSRTKKIILAVLSLIVFYIWWGNLELFFPQERASSFNIAEEKYAVKMAKGQQRIEYLSPKINPFLKPNESHQVSQSSENREKSPASLVKVDQKYQLAGILRRGRSSQVVIEMIDGDSRVLALNDSLGAWILHAIREDHAVFRQGKTNDTLWLVPK